MSLSYLSSTHKEIVQIIENTKSKDAVTKNLLVLNYIYRSFYSVIYGFVIVNSLEQEPQIKMILTIIHTSLTVSYNYYYSICNIVLNTMKSDPNFMLH